MSEENGTFYASFQPEEAGEWKIHVTYDGQDIEHSPFKCMVFNPRAIVVSISYFPFQTFIYIIEEVGLVTQIKYGPQIRQNLTFNFLCKESLEFFN